MELISESYLITLLKRAGLVPLESSGEVFRSEISKYTCHSSPTSCSWAKKVHRTFLFAPQNIPHLLATTDLSSRNEVSGFFPPLLNRDVDKTEQGEHHLRARLGGVGCCVILRRDFDNIGTDNIEPLKAAKNFKRFTRRKTADFRRAGARGIDRIETVDVEGEIGGARADDPAGLLRHRRPHRR